MKTRYRLYIRIEGAKLTIADNLRYSEAARTLDQWLAQQADLRTHGVCDNVIDADLEMERMQ